jgi:two-component system, OmpR family, response regulator
MTSLSLLVVEDEVRLAESLCKGLGEEGFQVEWTDTAEAAARTMAARRFDLIVLDLQLPGKNGLELLREMRAAGDDTPALILTAHGTLEERVAGLDTGADDYLVKPFAFAELLARIRALGRRKAAANSHTLKVGPLEFDTTRRRVRLNGEAISFSPKETMLLELLMRHAGQSVTRAMIAETVWDSDLNTFTNLIDVFINRLRQKLGAGVKIQTVRGVGYSIHAE